MALEFKLTKEDSIFSFNLVNEDGSTLLLGGEYTNQEEVKQAIADVKVGTLVSQQIAAGKVKSGETFFVIKDKVGNIIAKSLLFDNPMLFDNTLHQVKDSACIAEIKE